jgi:RNA polymerase sigma-70 factor (ECF subfamily)
MTKADFELIVHERQGMVYSIAYNFFRNSGVAEDVAQDVFLQLYENRNAVQVGPHCVAWLRRTTIHRCIDTWRRASLQHEVQLEQLPDIPADCSEDDPLLMDKLGRLIASLPEKQRSVLVLRYGEDMDVAEISSALQMPSRTVWSHLQRATALIREKVTLYLKEYDNESVRTRSS